MKVFYLVNKDVELRKNGEWVQPSLQYLLSASEVSNKQNERFKVVASREHAEALALDDQNIDKEKRFFPIFRVEVPDAIDGFVTKAGKIPALGFFGKHLTITDIYLSHINENYKDISVAVAIVDNRKAKLPSNPYSDEIRLDEFFGEPTSSSAKSEISTAPKSISLLSKAKGYAPSPKTLVKNGLPLMVAGTAFYVGNDVITALAANYSIPLAEGLAASAAYLPEAVANSPALLPVAAGVGTRLAVEVPEVSASLFSKAWSGLKSLAKKAGDLGTATHERWKEYRVNKAAAKAGTILDSQAAATAGSAGTGAEIKDLKEETVAKSKNRDRFTAATAKKRLTRRPRASEIFEVSAEKPESQQTGAGEHLEANALLDRLDTLTSISPPESDDGVINLGHQTVMTTAYEAAGALTPEVEASPPSTPPAERRTPSPVPY